MPARRSTTSASSASSSSSAAGASKQARSSGDSSSSSSSGSNSSTASPPVRRGSRAPAAGAGASKGRSTGTPVISSAAKVGTPPRQVRGRRIVESDSDSDNDSDSDSEEKDGDDDDIADEEQEQEASKGSGNEDSDGSPDDGEVLEEDDEGLEASHIQQADASSDSDDGFDETIVEQSLLPDSPAEVPQPRRARIASAAAQNKTPSRRTPLVKHEDKSPTPTPTEQDKATEARFALHPPSSPASPHTPVPASRSSASRASAQPMQTPAPAHVRTPGPAAQTGPTTPGQVQAAPKTRLVIHKMVLRNFKSYAGDQTIGPFHKSFSAVVGPNGSGKSNVIDAMLFVFGWRANKMRQGKLSELIHNSAGHEHIGSCTVEVWFRDIVDLPGPDDYKVVPNSRLVVARTAYRNNSSVYTLNSKKSSFTEVTTLLKARGIDLDHKRFLILQGEVESIAQMPPKAKNEHEEGLLEYLEDIIGTSSYKTPIEEANKKVDELNEIRSERLSRLKIVQKEKDTLEPKKREAETFLRDQNELTTRQSAMWQMYMLECKDEMHIASTSMDKLRKRIEEETEKHAGSRAAMEALETEYKQVNGEFNTIAKEVEKVTKEITRLEKEEVQLQEKRKHLDSKKKKLSKSLADDKKATSEAAATQERSTDEIETLGNDVAKLEASLEKEEAELEKIREGLKGRTQEFSQAIEEKQRELQPWTAKRSGKQNAKNVALEERRLLEERFGQAEKETDEAKAALTDLETTNGAKEDVRARLKGEKLQQAKKAKQYEEELQSMQSQETSLRSKASTSRAKCDEAKASMQSNQSRGEVLNSLARQADLGMVKGFHGRLGNLGVIDEKFDIAISTACPGLDNIVVDGVETGQACIEHLRRNNLGRANFILLNSLAKMNMGRIDTPEDVPRLFDLVTPREPRFAAAFYHQLRDTLVARDLAQANRIAYGAQRYRVVTLDGQLIDKSGTMSGGGTRVARGGMSSKPVGQDVTLEQLSRLDKEWQLDQDTLANHIKYMNEMRNLLQTAKARLPEIDMEVEKIEMDLSNGAKMVEEAKRRLRNLKSQHGPDAGEVSRVAQLSAQVEKLDAELDELSATTSAIEAEIAALQEKILEAGGIALRSQKSKVDGIRERSELFNERITKAEVAKTKAEKDFAKLSKSTQKNNEALEGLDAELLEVQESMISLAKVADEVRSKAEESQYSMETKQEARDEIKSKLDSCTEGINAFRSLEVEIKQKLEDNEKSHVDNDKRLKHWQEKLEKLELHRIDGDVDEAKSAGKGVPKEQSEAGHDDDENDPAPEHDSSGDASVSPELQEFSPDELRGMSKDTIKAEIVVYEEKLQNGQANLSVLEEYRRRENEFLARAHDLEETTQERDRAKDLHDNLRKERLESFMAGFSVISAKLKEMYQTITLGGNAELELVDSLDPFSEGILFSVMPPKKSWKNISNLSGGEKTLSSLALVFALHAFKPTPLYAMDELDAALDFRNVSIVANLIKERTKGAQFIVISLRNNMFELSSRLVGIYKTNGQTKSLAVHNSDLHAPHVVPQPPRSAMSTRASQPPWATPRMTASRSVAPTPALGQSAGGRLPSVPPSTVRRSQQLPPSAGGMMSQLSQSSSLPPASLMTPAPSRFSIIPQTPRTGNIKGLGLASTASSIKLTSSHSVRGGGGGLGALHERGNAASGSSIAPTPLASRRQN